MPDYILVMFIERFNFKHPEEINNCFKFRLVVKTALKLLVVFVEFSEDNCAKFLMAIKAIDEARGKFSYDLFSFVFNNTLGKWRRVS